MRNKHSQTERDSDRETETEREQELEREKRERETDRRTREREIMSQVLLQDRATLSVCCQLPKEQLVQHVRARRKKPTTVRKNGSQQNDYISRSSCKLRSDGYQIDNILTFFSQIVT